MEINTLSDLVYKEALDAGGTDMARVNGARNSVVYSKPGQLENRPDWNNMTHQERLSWQDNILNNPTARRANVAGNVGGTAGGIAGSVGGLLAGGAAGAAIGSVVPGPGTVIGGIAGAGLGILGSVIGGIYGDKGGRELGERGVWYLDANKPLSNDEYMTEYMKRFGATEPQLHTMDRNSMVQHYLDSGGIRYDTDTVRPAAQ